MRVDAEAAFEEATDARSLMPMQIGAAARREGDAVAAKKKRAPRGRLEPRRELFAGSDAAPCGGGAAGVARHQLPAPQRCAAAASLERDRTLAAQRLLVPQRAVSGGYRSMHDEDHPWQRRQRHLTVARHHVFEE